MRKRLFFLKNLLIFATPMLIVLPNIFLFELECDFDRAIYLVPLFYLLVFSSLFVSLDDNDDYYIRIKLIQGSTVILIFLGVFAIFFHNFSLFISVFISSGLVIYITKKIKDFKEKNDKRNHNRLIY
ncbi:hypothetical protein [Candidatus Albibeggiatoa sp. nov. BB20]|uniref:hypothetical protein n=1 Tax=Candidatus Albibeggiatoa sp. nov. BB20 TaxID=3162723 RepID=UPI003365AF8C